MKIAIDGPSGAGKSTVAKMLAEHYGIVYVDTGAMYRSVGLFARRAGTDPHDETAVSALLPEIKLELKYTDAGQRIIMCGEDVSDLIRTPEASMYASAVSALPAVRRFLLGLQQNIAAAGNVIMDGRDIGTVIMPDADVKIYLTASEESRAQRRWKELCAKGEKCSFEEVLSDMKQRDANDSGRAVAPAVAAEDAEVFDNSGMGPDETVAALIAIISEKERIRTVRQVAKELEDRGWHITFAESCTGGLAAARLVDVPSVSGVFDESFVTYANEAKIKYLGVSPDTISKFGVVSNEVAMEMAEGAAASSGAQAAVGISGIAGPTGATAGKPVGTVSFGFVMGSKRYAVTEHFDDVGRNEVRTRSVDFVFDTLKSMLEKE